MFFCGPAAARHHPRDPLYIDAPRIHWDWRSYRYATRRIVRSHAYRHARRALRYVARTREHFHGGLTSVTTAVGPITVASAWVDKFEGFIADLVASGYRPNAVSCYSPTGHMRNSLHHIGEACDIDQRARNRTAGRMYHVRDLAAKWGLRDGCSFHDCGHIDTGRYRGYAVAGH